MASKLNISLVRRILAYTKPYKALFIASVFLTLSLSVFAIVRPLLIKEVLNKAVSETKDVSYLNLISLLILISLVTEAVLQTINIRVTSLIGQSIVNDLRNQVYKHILKLKNAYFDNTPVGMLVTRCISDIESLSDVFAQGFIVIAGDILMLLIFCAVMLNQNWMLSLLAFSTIPFLFVATALFKKGVKKTFTMVRNAVSNLNTFTQEHITGMSLIQTFNREQAEYKKFTIINQEHRDANIKSIFYYSVFFPVVDILAATSIALIIWFAGIKSNQQNINLGDVTFFIMMVNLLFRPIRMLADRLNTIQMGFVSAERVFKVLDTNEIIEDVGTIEFKSVQKNIVFDQVDFSYLPDVNILNKLSFEIKKGESVAFVGATGSGKTTIINLLSRFYEINNGSIKIDGRSIQEYTLNSLRQNTGVVLQDVHLFNDSVLNNITLNNPEITLESVEKATKEIGLYDYIQSLPGGFNYKVSERGQSLSAGQKQLIAFIRAYVYNPGIFILDEATATIDSETETLIKSATDKISKNRTSIIIAHRLSTIKNVDKIFVLEKGKILEEGSPIDLLMNTSGKFYAMYNSAQPTLV
ncbi:MAG: ABC transporter ATP-binding protein [Bacteroidota bacterium]|nr:ABC transporter ATP-binding protein [Bacteroidota bacterium]MCA6442475.1 ABC transporter ATP-binding protein [Bacteroidota bacterium]